MFFLKCHFLWKINRFDKTQFFLLKISISINLYSPDFLNVILQDQESDDSVHYIQLIQSIPKPKSNIQKLIVTSKNICPAEFQLINMHRNKNRVSSSLPNSGQLSTICGKGFDVIKILLTTKLFYNIKNIHIDFFKFREDRD